MMELRVFKLIHQNGAWLNSLALLFSAVVWLAVSSSWAVNLHAVAKLGFGASAFGSVNILLLILGFVWPFAMYIFASITCRIFFKMQMVAYLVAFILFDVVAIGVIAVAYDSWFARYPILGLMLEMLELCIAGYIGWVIFFKPGHRSVASSLLGSFLFGILGLIAVTAFGLLIFPRTTFRLTWPL
jgi:hypothetical protein